MYVLKFQQIHQCKKSNKFECKMCGEKQSIKRHYGIGSGKDCRLHVQRLNSLRGDKEANTLVLSDYDDEEFEDVNEEHYVFKSGNTREKINGPKAPKQSKWSTFVDDTKENDEEAIEKPMFLGDQEVMLELPRKKQNRKVKVNTKTSDEIEENSAITMNTLNSFDSNIITTRTMVESNNKGHNELEYNFLPIEHSNNIGCSNIHRNKKENSQSQDIIKPISKSSKWAQYVETTDINETCGSEKVSETISTDNLFSLCEDSDLDNVLDI